MASHNSDIERFKRFIAANKPTYSCAWEWYKWLSKSYPEDYIVYQIFYYYYFEIECSETGLSNVFTVCSYLDLELLNKNGHNVYNELCEDNTIASLTKLILLNMYYRKYAWNSEYDSYKIVEIVCKDLMDENRLVLYSHSHNKYVTLKISKILPAKKACDYH